MLKVQFDLASQPQRTAVIQAAGQLGLLVTFGQGQAFDVTIRDPMDAYRLGQQTKANLDRWASRN